MTAATDTARAQGTPGLLISAPASGTGKTTLMLGLLRAFRNAGLRVQPFKSGPDYIDPAFHTAASGRASVNLDTWSMSRAELESRIGLAAQGADLALAEGSMGLFDGVARPGLTGTGASADLAALAGWPVILVVNASGQAQSAAAVARGFAGFRAGVRLAGVILNRVSSPRHEALIRQGMTEAGIAVLGMLPHRPSIAIPARHLGLVQAGEQPELEHIIEAAAEFVGQHIDLHGLRALAATGLGAPAGKPAKIPPPGQRVALASDAAFSFVYPHLMQDWQAAGAQILPFSPLADEVPDPAADSCWLPGGYPELHAGRLGAARRFQAALRAFAHTRPVHGECGGYMAMGAGLIDANGDRHEMAGLLGLVTTYEKRRMNLGYRKAVLTSPIAGQAAGALLLGHEFHYSTVVEQPDSPLALVTDATGAPVPEAGSCRGLATGTFFHMISRADCARID